MTDAEEKRLNRLLSNPPASSLGPFAWADLARGIDVQVAAAREVSGYYQLQAERDALAAMVAAPKRKRRELNESVDTNEKSRTRAAGTSRVGNEERITYLLGLFAYHRDAPLVARALGVPVADLQAELDSLRIRSRAYRLTRGTDADLPAAAAVKGPSGPPVRRRARPAAPSPAAPEAAPAPAPDPEQALLKSLLAEVGPRRAALAQRLGTSGGALLARFRAAGLERELSLRERDLIRALWSKHRASEEKVAAELGETREGLRDIVVMRGLARELDAVRDRLRHEVRRKKWPADRIDQVLRHADELRDLGLYDELRREVAARAGVVWTSLRGKSDALDLFAKKLRLRRDDAIRLQKLLELR
ncbi:MAG TPA: hypothetical protein VIR81_09780 [Myxococcales bacterium]|nr:hypothetical protein [Myxococcales bacterium]